MKKMLLVVAFLGLLAIRMYGVTGQTPAVCSIGNYFFEVYKSADANELCYTFIKKGTTKTQGGGATEEEKGGELTSPSVCRLNNGLGDFLVAYYDPGQDGLLFRIIDDDGDSVAEGDCRILTNNENFCLVPWYPKDNVFLIIYYDEGSLLYHIVTLDDGKIKIVGQAGTISVDRIDNFISPSGYTYGDNCLLALDGGNGEFYNTTFNALPHKIWLWVANGAPDMLLRINQYELWELPRGVYPFYNIPISYDGKTATMGYPSDPDKNQFIFETFSGYGKAGQFEFRFKKNDEGVWESDLQELVPRWGETKQDLINYMKWTPETIGDGHIITAALLNIDPAYDPYMK